MDKNDFWDFSPADKWDVINERSTAHIPLIQGALSSPQTGVEEISADNYILYGPVEGLAWKPHHIVYKLGMLVFSGFLKVIKHE